MPADIARLRKRVLEALLASPRGSRYSGTAGGKAAYAVTQEITDAILEADMQVCRAIVETTGHPYAAQFMAASSNLAHGTLIPAFVGAVGDVYVDTVLSKPAHSREEIIEIRENAALYPLTSPWHFIENSVLYHTGTNGVVWRPVLAITSACQSPESYEAAVYEAALMITMKDGGDPNFFQYHANIYAAQDAAIRNKLLIIPEAEQLERSAA